MIKGIFDQLITLVYNFPASLIQSSGHKSSHHLVGLDLYTCTVFDLKSVECFICKTLENMDIKTWSCWTSSFNHLASSTQKESSTSTDTCQLWCELRTTSLKQQRRMRGILHILILNTLLFNKYPLLFNPPSYPLNSQVSSMNIYVIL